MGQQGGVFVQLNPADAAVILHVLRDFRFIDSQIFGQLALQAFFGNPARASADFSAPPAARQIAETHAKGLACLDVIRRGLIGL